MDLVQRGSFAQSLQRLLEVSDNFLDSVHFGPDVVSELPKFGLARVDHSPCPLEQDPAVRFRAVANDRFDEFRRDNIRADAAQHP